MANEGEPDLVGQISIRAVLPGEKDLVIRFGLDGMRKLARAALHQVRKLEAANGLKVDRCGMCGRKARVG